MTGLNRMRNIGEVVQNRLCLGFGACEPVCLGSHIRLFDFQGGGIGSIVKTDAAFDNVDPVLP